MAPPVLDRVGDRIDALPKWVQPVALGPLLLLLLMRTRGAFTVGPIVVVILLFMSKRPFHDFAIGTGCLFLLLSASALGGLMYSLLGRHVKGVRVIGPFVAGILSITPYAFAVIPLIRLREQRPLLEAPESYELIVVAIMAILFGSLLGGVLFVPPKTNSEA